MTIEMLIDVERNLYFISMCVRVLLMLVTSEYWNISWTVVIVFFLSTFFSLTLPNLNFKWVSFIFYGVQKEHTRAYTGDNYKSCEYLNKKRGKRQSMVN